MPFALLFFSLPLCKWRTQKEPDPVPRPCSENLRHFLYKGGAARKCPVILRALPCMALSTLTKNSSCRWWCFTWHVPDDVTWEVSQETIAGIYRDERVSAVVANPEVAPITGQRHWQAVVRLNTPRKFGWVKQLLPDNAHIEKCKGAYFISELTFMNLSKCE